MLAYLATALAHLQADDYAHMRHMRIKLPRVVRRERVEPRPEQSCRGPDCACCAKNRQRPPPEIAPGKIAAPLVQRLSELQKAA